MWGWTNVAAFGSQEAYFKQLRKGFGRIIGILERRSHRFGDSDDESEDDLPDKNLHRVGKL